MTHAVKPAKVTNGGNHHRSVRSVRAVICARPADASVVDDTSGKPRLLRNRRAVAEAAARVHGIAQGKQRPTVARAASITALIGSVGVVLLATGLVEGGIG